MESLLNPPKKDKAPVWFEVPSKTSPSGWSKRVFPADIANKLLADKNNGYKLCEPDFVSANKVRPTDEGKNNQAMRNANTEMTGTQYSDFVGSTVSELKVYAQQNDISLTGLTKKKEILEAIEEAGKLL